jgi:alkylhydroperoxidase/carboxymuconolactone decarboxylase family protein YurZ
MTEDEFQKQYDEITSRPEFKEGLRNWSRDLLLIALALWLSAVLYFKLHS